MKGFGPETYITVCPQDIPTQEIPAEEESAGHQDRAEHSHRDQRCINRCLHPVKAFGPEELRNDDRTAAVAAESKRDENQCDFIGIADCGQGVLAYEFAGYQGIRDIVKLLEYNTAE